MMSKSWFPSSVIIWTLKRTIKNTVGECWRLRLTFSNQQTLVACFVTYDDHHNAAKQYSLHGRIWSEREALSEANKMVAEFIED